ncbi:4-amino-4-deoxychorismate lyase [Caldalkalibacillus thermarum]|uniref:aminodeoxychorismate lyase n=1 Tax=Caldalkalibacillus thermarum TaxID=296745 RepID=UPI0016682BE6|nr:aminodeoxychorismate lyase [Caldalkalibacillus thermarum]GGK33436.1 4-amino-4-deoxychorismate lyase [Caldalkalibacillus thermarum]
MLLLLNGKLVAKDEAHISVFDHGFLYGAGLFETFRTYQGHPFLLDDHLARLEKGCREIGLPWQADRERVVRQIECLLEANRLEDGRFRLNVSAGAAPVGLPSTPYDQVTEILFVSPVSPAPDYKVLRTVSVRRNEPEKDERWKSHHFLNNLLAQREVPAGAEGVMLTKSGKVAEGVISNLFFIKQGKLYTPALSTGILNGITRQWVLRMASLLGIMFEEGEYDLPFAQEAEEVFITNSVQELVAVTQWDERSYPDPDADAVVTRLRQYYHQQKTKLWSIGEICL